MVKEVRNVAVILLGALLIAAGFNLFLVPLHLLSGGVSGLAMLTAYFSPLSISTMYLAYNVPILISGWFLLGRRFVGLSILSVAGATWFISLIPTPDKLLASDTLISAVFGGVLVGLGSGISFRVGGSSGGFDIIGSIITRYRDFPVGNVLVGLNASVILAMGYLEGNWDLALASMISIYISGKVVDLIHVSHIKITLFIVTDKTDAMVQRLLTLPRGVTKIRTEGAFTHKEKDMLMTVTTRYELTELREIIKQTDPQAFVNIVETVGVMGSFRRR
ncbi:YitT family protein [Paenibacillus sp. TH7-28]